MQRRPAQMGVGARGAGLAAALVPLTVVILKRPLVIPLVIWIGVAFMAPEVDMVGRRIPL